MLFNFMVMFTDIITTDTDECFFFCDLHALSIKKRLASYAGVPNSSIQLSNKL